MRSNPFLSLVPVVLALAVSTPSQERQPNPPPSSSSPKLANVTSLSDTIIPIHTAEDDPVGGPYGTWAAGDDYKASFHGEPTFVPYLGGDYPQTQHLSFSTRSITAGGVEILQERRVPRRARDDRFEYVRGAVVEAYDVRLEGLEQTFTFGEPLPAGDLEVRMGLDTQLTMLAVDGVSTPVHFVDQSGSPILEYGEAIVFDAGGRRGAVRTVAEAGEIRLRVDAAWLEEAVYPVVIDPLVRVMTLESGAVFSTIDSYHSDANGALFVVSSRFASSTDEDVVMRRSQLSLASNSVVFSDLNSSWSTQHPQVSGAGQGPTQVVAVFSRRFATNISAVRFHTRDGSTSALLTDLVFLNNPAGFQTWRADVGGTETTAGGTRMLLVYQMDPGNVIFNSDASRIGARVLDMTTSPPTVGGHFVIPTDSTRPTRDADFPSVNQVARGNGSLTTWVVVWQEWDVGASNEDWDVFGRQVVATGFVSPSTWRSFEGSNSPTSHRTGPQVAGTNNGNYAVIFGRSTRTDVPFKSGLVHGFALDFERFDWPDGGLPRQRRPNTLVPYSASRVWQTGAAAYDTLSDSHWAFTYRSDRDMGGNGNVTIHLVGYDGGSLQQISRGTVAPEQGFAGGITYDPANFVYHVSFGAGGSNSLMMAFLEYEQPGRVITSGFSCSAASIEWTGVGLQGQAAGSEFLGPRVRNAPSNAVHFMLLSLTPVDQHPGPRTDPGCRRLVSIGQGYVGLFPVRIGSDVRWQLPLPVAATAGLTLFFQDWHTNAAGTRFQGTQRLEVPIGR